MLTVIDQQNDGAITAGLEIGRGNAKEVFEWPASEIPAGFRLQCPSRTRTPLPGKIDVTESTSERFLQD
jgi:hypothetical protein